MNAASPEQIWSSAAYAAYEENARFVSDLGDQIVGWLDPKPGERILDLGCGDGALTETIVASGATVVGVDTSADFVKTARERGVDAHIMSGDALDYDAEFDAVFSNAALHWMLNAEAVVAGVHRALKPSGRFVAEFGGHGNVAAIVTAFTALSRKHGMDERLAKPWFFPSAEEYGDLLSRCGFMVDRIEIVPRPTPLPTGIRGWIKTFREPFFAAAGERVGDLLDEIEALLAPALRHKDGSWTADYVRLRVRALKD